VVKDVLRRRPVVSWAPPFHWSSAVWVPAGATECLPAALLHGFGSDPRREPFDKAEISLPTTRPRFGGVRW